MAWVAGPVVGGVAGLAIIGLLVWVVLLLKRRNANKGVEAAPDPNYNNNLPPGSNMSQMYPSPQVTPAAGYADPVGEPYKYYPQGPPQSLYASPPPQGGYSQVPTQAAELHSTSSQGPWMSPAPSELPASESHGARSDAAELGGSDVRR
jgi:hypothetical protein